MGRVYYHHPGNGHFSLDFVNTDPATVIERVVTYGDDIAVKARSYDFERRFYVVYTSDRFSGHVDDIDVDVEQHFADLDRDTGTILARFLEIYRALIRDKSAKADDPVVAYKDVDLDVLPDVLDRTDWDGSAAEVAGRLASNVILSHPFPNANHRTAIAICQYYLRLHESDFSMPETTAEMNSGSHDWESWINRYIETSKALLTVRRKNVCLKHLRRHGTTTVRRKNGVEIDLRDYELDMYPSEAQVHYARKYRELWIVIVAEAVERAGSSELTEKTGLSKSETAERIRRGQ
jgi:hypothetical protein